jgi:chorismate mutase/prephenate dehydratase
MSQRREASAGPVAAVETEIGRLREAIDAVDRRLLELLNERARLGREIGRLKARGGLEVYAAGRERDLVEALRRGNPGPFPDEGLEAVFREIVSATRALERRPRVAYLGPAGTFAHEAARRQFGACAELVPESPIAAIFAAVERGEADLGVVPVENTTEGIVTETFDALLERPESTLCGEMLLRVAQHLLSRSGRLEQVRRVASHPQGLAQCRGWLDRHLPKAERVETPSTAAAAQLAARDEETAAVASAIAAETYGLAFAARCIEDERDNTTRFLLLGRAAAPRSGHDLTSAVFTVRKAQAGALHGLLDPFARHGVNLTSIQARPMPGKPFEYLFFVDVEGHRDDPAVADALREAAAAAHSHRVLGSFPRASAGADEACAGGAEG